MAIFLVGVSAVVAVTLSHAQAISGPAEAEKLYRAGDFEAAEQAGRALLEEIESSSPVDSLALAETLNWLSLTLSEIEDGASEATETARRALGLRLRHAGPEAVATAKAHRTLALALSELGEHAECVENYLESVRIHRAQAHPDSARIAKQLSWAAGWEYILGEYRAAKDHLIESIAINEQRLGPDHLELAYALNGLGSTLYKLSEYEAAGRAFDRALKIREEHLEPGHPSIAQSIGNAALMRFRYGDFVGAIQLFERSVAMREESYGPDALEVSYSLTRLGLTLNNFDEHARARPYLERSLRILESIEPRPESEILRAQGGLVDVLLGIGAMDEALQLSRVRIAQVEASMGSEHPDTADALSRLGNSESRAGNYEVAGELFSRALEIYRLQLEDGAYPVLRTRKRAATLLRRQGHLEEALAEIEAVLAGYLELLGGPVPVVLDQVVSRAACLRELGRFEEAAAVLDESLVHWHRYFGRDRENVGQVAALRALIAMQMGDVERAAAEGREAERVGQLHFTDAARALSESDALRFGRERLTGLPLLYSLALLDFGVEDAWGATIRARALVLDEMADRHQPALRRQPELRPLFEELGRSRGNLARLVIRGPSEGSPAEFLPAVQAARSEVDSLERAVGERSDRFRQDRERRSFGLKEIREALPESTALIGYARTTIPEELRDHEDLRAHLDSDGGVYLAFVLAPDASTRVLPLGGSQDIEHFVDAYHRAIRAGALADEDDDEAERRARIAGERLRRKVWDPLAPHLDGAKRVFVVADGHLQQLNLGSLPIADGHYLVEQHLFQPLTTERDLVPESRPAWPSVGLLAMGGPAFDDREALSSNTAVGEAEPDAGPMDDEDLPASDASGRLRGSTSDCGEFADIRFEPLPSAAREVEAIARAWEENRAMAKPTARVLTGAGASESAFKRLASGHRVLHLASHAFFLGQECRSGPRNARGVAGLVAARDSVEVLEDVSPDRGVLPANPLRLSGIALAGANRRAEAGADDEDGILTAEEVATLDLSGVEWAVLSGCDTGTGDIEVGEGVLGLRRAFRVAGARSLVMSLWSVNDETARQWMEAFYRHALDSGWDSASAARAASLELLRVYREAGESTHPFRWAAFTTVGGVVDRPGRSTTD